MPDISTKQTLPTLVGDEWLYVIATPSGTPADRKITPAILATYIASTPALAEAARDTIGATLVAGANITITVNDAGDQITIAAAGGGGGGAETNAWALPAALANPATPVTPGAISGSTIIRLTGITGAKTVNMPSATGVTGRCWALFDVTATGGPFNVTFAGATHDGIGTDPGLVLAVPANGRGTFVFYTDDAGTTWRYSGNYDFAANKATVLTALGIDRFKARFEIYAPTASTEILLFENTQIGTIYSAICSTDTGSCTAALQIADLTGAGNYTPTGAAAITGLGAIAVTTTPTKSTASAANTMAKTGTVDRMLLVALSGLSGSPGRVTIEVEWSL